MKYSFSDIREGSSIILMLHNGSVHMKMHGNIINLIGDDIATITLETSVSQVLKFDNIDLNMIYVTEEDHSYIWEKVKVVYFKNNYVLQVNGEGSLYNRRVTYRVGISRSAQLYTADDAEYRVTVKDVSLSGFSIADKNNELHFSLEDGVTIHFEDLDHTIDLYGYVIRIEERDNYPIYGFMIRRSCRDLPSYITTKLGDQSKNMPPSYVL